MVDNFEKIIPLLKFDSEDDFYHLQILMRKKENPHLGSNSYVVKTYYIRSIEYLLNKKDEIINLCEFNNARACINLNRRSFEKIAFHTLKKVTDQIMNKDFKSVRKAYESVCGRFSNEPEKKWVIDIDYKNYAYLNQIEMTQKFNQTIQKIEKLIEITGKDTNIVKIPTKNGEHWICNPFNTEEFKTQFGGIDIHKDNPTILYIS